MHSLMILLLMRLPVCICFGGVIYLLAIGVTTGWGWLIFAGIFCLCTGGSFTYKKDTDKGEK